MRVAILSDTHVPGRVRSVPEWIREEVRAADHVIHAGDWDDPETLALFEDLAEDALTGVRGNVDPPGIDLPRVSSVTLAGVAFVVTHGDGFRPDYREGVAERARAHAAADADTVVGVAGHTHQYVDATVDGVRVLNPGSATGNRTRAGETMMRATCADGAVEVERLTGR
jgi:hypothetical protein